MLKNLSILDLALSGVKGLKINRFKIRIKLSIKKLRYARY